jgi:hypothetical protein
MLKDDETSIYLVLLGALIEFMQVYWFAFHPTVQSIWVDNIAVNIGKVFGNVALGLQYYSNTWTFLVIVFYFCVGVLFIYSCGLIIVYLTLRRQKPLSPLLTNNMRILTKLFIGVLFIPMFYTFLTMVNCQNGSGGTLYNYSEVTCWNGMHILHGVVAIVAIIALAAYALVFSLLYFDGIYSEEKGVSKRTNR